MLILNRFGLSNFRVFKEYTEFDLAPITVLTGKNNSGKSSLKYLYLGLFICTYLSLFSQQYIVPKYKTPFAYDSSTNEIDIEKIAMLLGQNLFVLPQARAQSKGGYSYFFSRLPNYNDFAWNEYHNLYVKNPAAVYAPSKNNVFVSSTEMLSEKTFKVVDVLTVSDSDYPNLQASFLKLKGENGDSLYFGHPSRGLNPNLYIQEPFPFLIEGYFEKMSQKWLNQILIATQDTRMNDFETGNSLLIKSGTRLLLSESTVALIGEKAIADWGFLAKIGDTMQSIFIPEEDLPDEHNTHYGCYLDKERPYWIPEQAKAKMEKNDWQLLSKGVLAEGMSSYSVRLLMGKPAMIDATKAIKGGEEIISYHYGMMCVEVIFVNDKLFKIVKP